MSNHTLYELATDFDLFREYADTDATMTEEQFNKTPAPQKLRDLIAAFGTEGEGRNELAADSINGVYVCENPTPLMQELQGCAAEVLEGMNFYDALASTESPIFGNVSDSVAALIEDEYGIH